MLLSISTPAANANAAPSAPTVHGSLALLRGAAARPSSRTGHGGVGVRFEAGPEDGVPYALFVPAKVRPGSRVVVTVHGISRNATEHAAAFAPAAAHAGRIVVAPLFAEHSHTRYQMMAGGGRRADHALLATLDDVAALTGADVSAIDLFGFSGGAQFAHRFAMLHPGRVARLGLASAGWYTFPDRREPYPYGLQSSGRKAQRMVRRLAAFLRIPKLVLVGECDTERDVALRQQPLVDSHQGQTRVERAARWARAVRAAAVRCGAHGEVRFRVLPGCGHSFEECVARGGLAEQVMGWFETPS